MARWRTLKATGTILGITLAAAFLSWNYNLGGSISPDKRVDFNELLGLSVVIIAGFAWLGWKQIEDLQREIERRINAEEEARYLALHDYLTGLPNRRQLDDALTEATTILPGANRAHVLFMLDLNGFKLINDEFGHAAGDQLLSQAAQRIAGALRETDLLARIGGDEFAIVARDMAGSEDAITLAQRIVTAMSHPFSVGQNLHHVRTGIGIAMVPRDGKDAVELQRKADVALYRCKADRNLSFAFFRADMDKEVRERALLQRDLRKAIDLDEIVPRYQPIVDMRTGQVRGFEALARWTHAVYGEVAPERFIPIAEDTGMIGQLTASVLRQACSDARSWPNHVRLSVNLSSTLLHKIRLDEWLIDIIEASGLPLDRVDLEISENAVVRDLEVSRRALDALRRAGMRIALDDFGTGTSSLFHLRQLKFDVIKIDRSFVDGMNVEKESAAIVSALIGLCVGLGVEVVAEGVEQARQQESLLDQHCVSGQGFLFGRAVPAREALAMVSFRTLRLIS